MRTLKQLEANLKDGYQVIKFGRERFGFGHGIAVWVVDKNKKLVLPKEGSVKNFIQECIEKGLFY